MRFGVGDNVGIYTRSEFIKGKPALEGVMHNKLEYKLTISIDDNEEFNESDI